MKKAVLSSVLIAICILALAQVPESFNYQVVIRDGLSNNPLVNQNVSFRMSILKGSSSGVSQYSELHSATTSGLGLVNLVIGNGTVKTGNITTIDWGADTYYLKVEIDKTGGTTYVEMGTTQLLSVPYAMHSKTSETADYNNLINLPLLNISNWNTAFGWGNHSGLYMPAGYVPEWKEIKGNPISFVAPVHNQLLAYDADKSKWVNWTPNFVTTTGNQSISGNKVFTGITTVPTPVNATDAVTKAYVDALTERIELLEGKKAKDYDGNVYAVVRIGFQLWMAENLKTTKYNDGTDIPLVTDDVAWGHLINSPAYCWYNNNEASYKNTYGALYNYWTVVTNKLCPSTWHVPTDADWTELENYLIENGYNYDGTLVGNKIAKVLASNNSWNLSLITGAVGNSDYPAKRNAAGFTALPSGYRSLNGIFSDVGNSSIWWTNTVLYSEPMLALMRGLYFDYSYVVNNNHSQRSGYSVRCVRNY